MKIKIFLSIALTSIFALTAIAETVQLRDGYEIKGKVIKNDNIIAVDIGVTVVSLPKEAVVKIIDDEQARKDAEKTDNPTETGKINQHQKTDWELYYTADLPRATTTQCAERYGQGVVMVQTPSGLGSGFILNEQGYLITNYHVIARETSLKVVVFRKSDTGFEQKRYKKIKIIAFNPLLDLALLKIEDGQNDIPFKFVYLGEIEKISAGDDCFAIGNPLGLTRTVSKGIVSTPNRNAEGQLYIQTTADINPGNSGGPLFDQSGRVIGVTSMGYLSYGGLNFAIPVDVVKRFIDNRDAFAYSEDNPNAGVRYIQPDAKIIKNKKFKSALPDFDSQTDK
ncbi:MAG: trypsin-like peptidase domain-containing protein [Phycisphaerae bacterium]|nr:trypsin-like peptidase domain-containing protein [Phycisphaerae bacterium]